MKAKNINRRNFLRKTTAIALGTVGFPYVVSSSALGGAGNIAPSERLTMGAIGLGGQGMHNLRNFLTSKLLRILAVCDVDTNHRIRAKNTVDSTYGNKNCAAYNDFRDPAKLGLDQNPPLAGSFAMTLIQC